MLRGWSNHVQPLQRWGLLPATHLQQGHALRLRQSVASAGGWLQPRSFDALRAAWDCDEFRAGIGLVYQVSQRQFDHLEIMFLRWEVGFPVPNCGQDLGRLVLVRWNRLGHLNSGPLGWMAKDAVIAGATNLELGSGANAAACYGATCKALQCEWLLLIPSSFSKHVCINDG